MPLFCLNYTAYHLFYEDKIWSSTDEIRKFCLFNFFELIVKLWLNIKLSIIKMWLVDKITFVLPIFTPHFWFSRVTGGWTDVKVQINPFSEYDQVSMGKLSRAVKSLKEISINIILNTGKFSVIILFLFHLEEGN